MGEFHLLCGPPGSGKSTKANELRRANPNAVYLSCDVFVERVARFYGKTYNEVWQHTIKRAGKRMHRMWQKARDEQLDVIWDMCNLTQAERMCRQLPFPNHKKFLYYTDPDEKLLKERNQSRPRGAMDFYRVVKPKLGQYEKPEHDELTTRWDYTELIGKD